MKRRRFFFFEFYSHRLPHFVFFFPQILAECAEGRSVALGHHASSTLQTLFNYGVALAECGDLDAAAREISSALQQYPRPSDADDNLFVTHETLLQPIAASYGSHSRSRRRCSRVPQSRFLSVVARISCHVLTVSVQPRRLSATITCLHLSTKTF